ncbi:hypothetical protein DFH09DRAFT_1047655 [Mycena vulgaris]|nr:hypothetical protein DFH09DRAFT_1047655 [Mycena vulgaris]
MSSSNESFIEGRTLMYFSFTLVVQTFFFGAYTVLIVLSTRILLKRGLKTQSNKALFIVGLFMYTLTTAYWCYSVADVASRMQTYIDPENHISSVVNKPYNLFNALVLINYVLSDSVVCWRAWVICSRDHRKYLYIPIGFLLITAMSITATIALRIADLAKPGFSATSDFVSAINILQVSNVGTSFISNITSTGLIGATAWRHRQQIKDAFRKTTKANRILLLLLESGVFYCLSGLTVVVAMLIRMPRGTFGDIYIAVNIQFAGAYAPVVLLLVRNQTSLGDTDFMGSISDVPPAGTVRFGASAGHVRTVLSTIHFATHSEPQRNSFESGNTSESGNAEIEESLEEKKHALGAPEICEPGDTGEVV